VAVPIGFKGAKNSNVVFMPKPLYGLPVTKVINGHLSELDALLDERRHKPVFEGIRALIVDDEPMNLVVATGTFKDYGMITDTADSGQESIDKFKKNSYDIIFMDHMMPEMDGVEAMKKLRQVSLQKSRRVLIVALTANAISGAREMFLREGFDGFIAKPIDIMEFERVMKRLLPDKNVKYVERSMQ
jgi:CheY-like chemotaxis protein